MARRRVVMGLWFFPRGGSAQVTLYVAAALDQAAWSVGLVAGSLGAPGDATHAPTFFDGIELHHLDYDAAVRTFEAGGGAVAASVPLHPSYEDRAGAPDVLLAGVDPALLGHLASAWDAPLAAAGVGEARVAHLHHLTPQHDAVARHWPDVAVLAHLHGTELKMIEAVEHRIAVAAALGTTLESMADPTEDRSAAIADLDEHQANLVRSTRWDQWRHGEFWLAQLRRQAAAADHLVVVSPPDRTTAIEVLGVEPDRVTAIPNGVEVDRFRPRDMSTEQRRARFRHWLVDDPRGWDETGGPGAVAYSEADVDRILPAGGDATVVIYVGRFTSAKRVPLLVRAFSQARPRFERAASLLVWGGHPGEWEDEHPVTVARQVGDEGIFFAGWRGHDDLPVGLAASDVLVMSSVNDSFAQTALEAMAVGLPVLATLSGGFPSMINLDPARPTGWLVPPDDVDALAEALVQVVDHPAEVGRRGAHALAHARAELSWEGRVPHFEDAYQRAGEHRARRR